MFTTGYGSTETTAGVMSITWPTTRVGVGLPLPGIEAKLIPIDGERYEVRFRGDAVMPGYYNNPEATAAAFDEEGFYRSGDSLTFIDPERPEEGLAFAGRLAQLNSGPEGAAVRIGRFGILLEPPVVDAGEMSDKGSINQSISLRRRAADVDRLYAADSSGRVLASGR